MIKSSSFHCSGLSLPKIVRNLVPETSTALLGHGARLLTGFDNNS